MPIFKSTYSASGQTELMTATRYIDSKSWIVFQQDDDDGRPTEITRIKANVIRRIDLVPDEVSDA